MKAKRYFAVVVACLVCFSALCGCQKEETYPAKDITMIVPWNAGGSSDMTGRLVAAEMEQTLGVSINVVNTPGSNGAVGQNDCLLAEHDGYTIVASGAPYIHPIMEQGDWSCDDWDFLAAFSTPNFITVSADCEYQTFEELYAALQSEPAETITGATSGLGSAGYNAMAKLIAADPVFGNYGFVSYSGGSAAVTATLAGECVFTPQLSSEVIEHLRSGDMIALCTLTAEDLEVDGVGTIPSIKNFLPEIESALPCASSVGLLFPSDIPQDAKSALESSFQAAMKTDSVTTYAAEKCVIPVEDTSIAVSKEINDKEMTTLGFILYDAGIATKSPEEFGYTRP